MAKATSDIPHTIHVRGQSKCDWCVCMRCVMCMSNSDCKVHVHILCLCRFNLLYIHVACANTHTNSKTIIIVEKRISDRAYERDRQHTVVPLLPLYYYCAFACCSCRSMPLLLFLLLCVLFSPSLQHCFDLYYTHEVRIFTTHICKQCFIQSFARSCVRSFGCLSFGCSFDRLPLVRSIAHLSPDYVYGMKYICIFCRSLSHSSYNSTIH